MAKIRAYKVYYIWWVDSFKKALSNLKHQKVARWTLVVHIIYYIDSLTIATGTHLFTAAACGMALTLEFFAKD